MNKQDRKELEKAKALLTEAQEIVDAIKDAEQEKFDNLSEGLQCTERAQKFEDVSTTIDEIIVNLDEATE